MVAKMIVLLLWRECVLSRLFVYFREKMDGKDVKEREGKDRGLRGQ